MNNFSNKLAEVKTELVSVGGSQLSNKIAVSVRDDEGNFIPQSILSADYNLISNSRATEVMLDIFSRSGMVWAPFKTIWNGKALVDYYKTQSSIAVIRNGSAHEIHLGAMLRNSYDGSSCLGFDMFLLNCNCMNQWVSRNLFHSYNIRHTGESEFDFEDAKNNLMIGTDAAIKIVPRIQSLQETPLQLADLTAIKENVLIPQTKWGDVLDNLKEQEQTRYGAFQALTFVSSHKCSGVHSINIGSSICNYFLQQ